MVSDDSKITIDVLICHQTEEVTPWDASGSTWQNYWRMSDLKNRYHSTNATLGVMRAHPNINWRHHVHQKEMAEGIDMLDFSPEVTGPLLVKGKLDALEILGLK